MFIQIFRRVCLTLGRFTYPTEGYRPLQDPPTADLIIANRLLGYMKTVMATSIDTQVRGGGKKRDVLPQIGNVFNTK